MTVRDPQRGFLCFADHPTPARYLAHHLGEKLDDELRNIVSTELGVNRRARVHVEAAAMAALENVRVFDVAFVKALVIEHLVRRLFAYTPAGFTLIVCRDGVCERLKGDQEKLLSVFDAEPGDRAALFLEDAWNGLSSMERRKFLVESPDASVAEHWISQAGGVDHPRALVFDVPSWNERSWAPTQADVGASQEIQIARFEQELKALDKDLHEFERRLKRHVQVCGQNATALAMEKEMTNIHREILRREWWIAKYQGDIRTMQAKERAFSLV